VLATPIHRREGRALNTPVIDIHSSVGEEALARDAVESLRANRIDPKFLYVTPRQTELWREVFLHHSPVHGNLEFARIYRDAFERIAKWSRRKEVVIVGLGCGTGLKEAQLCAALKTEGAEPLFAAVDVSQDLVAESAAAVIAAGASHRRSLVCDLAESTFLSDWLDRTFGELPRIITFFGLVPNLAPSLVIRLFRAVLRHGDVMLVSAHLAPVSESVPLAEAMQRVVPQYDNAETLAWLTAGLEQWKLSERVESPRMTIGEVEGIPAFVATAKWRTAETFEQWGQQFAPNLSEPLRVFHSVRYTSQLFEEMLRNAGFSFEVLDLTACREEGIWAVRW
jgi:uncharacterized SAM-dependent methyltransferase